MTWKGMVSSGGLARGLMAVVSSAKRFEGAPEKKSVC